MKRIISTFCVMLLLPIAAYSYDAYIGGIYYNFSGSVATVTYKSTSDNSYSGSVVIPASVTYNYKTYSVTSIGSFAFSKCGYLTSVSIPNSVTSIGDYAFYNSSSLTSITIPGSVTSIGESAFHGCSGLTSVKIPNSVTSIGSSAFYECSSLTSVIVGKSVTSIGNYAFDGCSGLTSVTIGSGVASIGNHAFDGCNSLTSVHITDLAAWCKISFGSNPLYYAHHLFLNGKEIKDLVIPEGVTNIGKMVFYGCNGLTSVTIPNSVTSIGNSAFCGCTGLTSIIIPESVTSISGSAFYGCTGLTSVQITDLAAWCNISFGSSDDNPLYYAHHLYLNGQEVKDLVIPEGVTNIGKMVFYGCNGLTSVTISNSVTSIGSSAFANCI